MSCPCSARLSGSGLCLGAILKSYQIHSPSLLQPPNDPHGIQREDLILSLRAVLASTSRFAEVGLGQVSMACAHRRKSNKSMEVNQICSKHFRCDIMQVCLKDPQAFGIANFVTSSFEIVIQSLFGAIFWNPVASVLCSGHSLSRSLAHSCNSWLDLGSCTWLYHYSSHTSLLCLPQFLLPLLIEKVDSEILSAKLDSLQTLVSTFLLVWSGCLWPSYVF